MTCIQILIQWNCIFQLCSLLCVFSLQLFIINQISHKEYLCNQKCKCCGTGLDKLKKADIRQLTSLELVDKLNSVKPTIITRNQSDPKKKKSDKIFHTLQRSNIELRDLVCKTCISYANYNY